jgi:hypothetical protein
MALAMMTTASCKKKYECTSRGDVSKLADWRALGVVPFDEQAQVCFATADRLEVVYTTPAWPVMSKTVEANAKKNGWTIPTVQGLETFKLGKDSWQASFAKCKNQVVAGATYSDCTEPLSVEMQDLPHDLYKDQPYRLSAHYSKTATRSYVNGKPR